ncbi:MAG: hypothetical protein L0287_25750 [Anaerolineae bacterium]|nr:hypothetical protein [Anaerolineae bacterium]MCI0611245.1 hypothetical protein [Anaerolineae bacterium]
MSLRARATASGEAISSKQEIASGVYLSIVKRLNATLAPNAVRCSAGEVLRGKLKANRIFAPLRLGVKDAL